VEREVLGFVHVNGFNNYHFVESVSKDPNQYNTLYIDVPGKLPSNAKIQKTFYLLNGEKVLIAYTL